MAVSVKDAETVEKTAEKADEKKKSGTGRTTGAKKTATPRARTKKADPAAKADAQTEATATPETPAADPAPAKSATPRKKTAAATGTRRASSKKSDQTPADEAPAASETSGNSEAPAAKAAPAAKSPARGKSSSPRGRKSAAQAAPAASNASGDAPAAEKSAAAPAAAGTDTPAAVESPAKAPAAAKSAAKGARKSRSAQAGKDGGEQAPSAAVDTISDEFAGKAPDSAVGAAPDAAVEAASDATPETASDKAPDAAPDAASDAGRTSSRKGRSRGGRGRKKSGGAATAAAAATDATGATDAIGPQSAADGLQSASDDAGADLETAADDDLADFPTGFGDTGPEDIFAMEDDPDSGDEATAEGSRKRKRTRRGGRGRRKTAAHDENGESGAQIGADPAEAREAAEDDDEADDLPEESEAEAKSGAKGGRRKMFVSVLAGEQVEVVITEEGQVQEYYVEMLHQAKIKGNIYKGVVHNVDANLQAAFVNYGQVKNGFLQIDEIHPEYYVVPHEAAKGRKYPPIQKVLKPGQEVLVQVVKEPAGTKGAFLTTYLSLPGRFLVLTPGREQIGVSRKVDNESERARLRELLEGLSPGAGLGVIVRTVSMGASKTSLQRDLQFLKRTWKDVRAKGLEEKAPALVYQEMDLTARAVRDYLTDAISEIWIDDEETAATVTEVAQALFPRKKNLVRIHKESAAPLFERFNVQRQLDQIQSREVALPSGGRLVIDPTEALTAIDINSGRSGGKSNFEDMAFRTNMEAAKMIPLQLRLRDIGGQVVADFIEMRDKNHWREVEKTLRNGMKVDRARYDVGKISAFGLLEIVRQRLGSSAISISTEPCPCCNGTGVRRNMEWQSLHALRDIQRLIRNAQAQKEDSVTFAAEGALALHLLNNKRQRLSEMEQASGVQIEVVIKV